MAILEQTFVVTAKTHKMRTVLVSFSAQTILVVAGILIPMIYFDDLPTAQLRSLLLAPPPAPPTPPTPHPRLLGSSSLFRVRLTPTSWWPPGNSQKYRHDYGRRFACAIRRDQRWRRKPRRAHPHAGSGSGRGSTTSSLFCPEERADASPPDRRHRAIHQVDSPAEASLSATGQAGSRSGGRQAPCLDLQGRHHRGAKGRQRPPAACPIRLRSGETVGISTDPTQWRARRS